ncbi:MAG: peptide chain release factor 2 [Candidatus Omnitrophica bacterium]|nr:peptide chain release factor 2 [Candidatus Omnitrophota bacterium]
MEEIRKQIENHVQELATLGELLKLDDKRTRVRELQSKMAQQDFWQDQKNSSKVIEELKDLKGDVEEWDALKGKLDELKELLTFEDAAYEAEMRRELNEIARPFEQLKLKVLFCDKFDDANALVEINSGAGGTEACDWANMLYRMYFRWAEDKKFAIRVLVEVRGEEAGLKNITFFVEGKRAYGLLKSERGVHRLVRISPFDANKRWHTSFASVDVSPEIEDVDIEIKPEDLKIDTFRASGAGGQHVNKTDSAVRMTHLPTGIIVGSQNERSQHQNRLAALRALKIKLYELKEQTRKQELKEISGIKQKIEWGSQIRSYVLYPYLLVKDHRTDFESHDAWGVLDGKLEEFIYAYLKYRVGEREAVTRKKSR